MKISIISFLLICILSSSCQKENNNIAYKIEENDLIPEGITYAEKTNSFYLSSICKTKIIQINASSGKHKDFIPSDLMELRYLGMITNEKLNQLWACGNITKNNQEFSYVCKFDLQTGDLLKSYTFKDTIKNLYNDLVQDKHGNIYFTDIFDHAVYIIDVDTDSVMLFYKSDEILYPNGITISPDSKLLFIASTNNGIRTLDIASKEILGDVDTLFDSKGIDGLKFYKNSLIGIQNDVQKRSDVKIARYFLNDSGTKIVKMEIIDQDNPLFNIPTTFAIVKDEIFCIANSQLANLDGNGGIRDRSKLEDILILKYDLE